jgi:hypothetical protein
MVIFPLVTGWRCAFGKGRGAAVTLRRNGHERYDWIFLGKDMKNLDGAAAQCQGVLEIFDNFTVVLRPTEDCDPACATGSIHQCFQGCRDVSPGKVMVSVTEHRSSLPDDHLVETGGRMTVQQRSDSFLCFLVDGTRVHGHEGLTALVFHNRSVGPALQGLQKPPADEAFLS